MSEIIQAKARVAAAAFTAPLPSWKTMEETLRQWHEQSLNDPEYLWLEHSFEDMADSVSKAMFCAGEPRDTSPDNGWMARQDGAA